MYSKEDIERKRLVALARKHEKYAKMGNIAVQRNPEGNRNICSNGKNQEPNRSICYSKNNLPGSSSNKPAMSPGLNNSNFGVLKQKQPPNRFDPMKTNQFYGKAKQDVMVTGNCIMIQNSRFAVELSKYHPPVIDVFKTIPSKAYDSQKRTWHFHIKDYDLLLESFLRRSDCTIKGLPTFTRQIFERLVNQKEEDKIDLSPIDATLRESLMPFQQDGIRYGISKKGRCMIADDMGLGKTIQALGIAHYYKENWPLLIVTPSSVRYQWSEAIHRFLPSVPVQCVQHFRKNEYGFEFSKITIVSYDLLARSVNLFEQNFFGVVIFDESHFLKSCKTARYKAAKQIAVQANHVILLSGTPVLSRPMELYSQINLIIPIFMAFTDYGIRYCAGIKRKFGWDYSGSSNLEELDLLLKACCLIRRVKSDVLTQLPSKIRQVVMLDPTLIAAGTKEMEQMAATLQRKTLSGSERHSALLQYYSESSVAKQKAVCNYISDLLENGEKFLVFAHHQGVLDAICNVISSKKTQYIRIDGRTNPEQRKFFVDKFQNNKEVLVAVLSITAANAGITLTAARLVVFAEITWNPGILCQAEDRVHRIGQDRGVVIQYLIGKNTVDDYLWPKIQCKLEVLNKVGLDQDFSVNANDVTAQVPKESDQKRIDEFVDRDSSSKSNGVPHLEPCPKPLICSASSSQSRLDSFVSKSVNHVVNTSENRGKETKESISFDQLLDEDDIFDINMDEFV